MLLVALLGGLGGVGAAGATMLPSGQLSGAKLVPNSAFGKQETFQNSATGLCLTPISPSVVGTDQPKCGATPNRDYWDVNVMPDTSVTLGSDEYVGRCIDDSAQYGLRLYTCNSSYYQNWVVYHDPANVNLIDFENEATDLCLDDSAAGLRAYTCNGLSYQYWG